MPYAGLYTGSYAGAREADLTGPLELVTPVNGQLLTTAEGLAQARQDATDDSTQLDSAIKAATEYVESLIPGHRQLLTATYDQPLRDWWCRPFKLPRPPLQTVTWVKYYDTSGVQQTLASSYYEVRTPWRQPGQLVRAPLKVWPPLQCGREYPVTVRFVAGYASAALVPERTKQAVRLLATWFYARRGDELPADVLKTVDNLLRESEDYGFYG